MVDDTLLEKQATKDGYFEKRVLQVGLLLKKNFILAKRNRRATFLQLGVPLIFILLLFLLSLDQGNAAIPATNQPVQAIDAGVVRCYKWNGQPCVSLAVSPMNDTDVRAVVSKVQAASSIPDDEVKYFATPEALDDYLLANENTTLAGFIFRNGTYTFPHSVQYEIVYNQTTTCRSSADCTDPTRDLLLRMQVAMDRAIVSHVTSNANFDLKVGYIDFPRPALTQDLASALAPTFIFGAIVFSFVIQISSIVTEKENKLREGLRVMGLKDSSFWLSWFLYVTVVNTLSALILCVAGIAFGIQFFVLNEFSTYFVLFFLFETSISLLAFFLSTLLTRSSAASTMGFLFFLVGLIIQSLAGVIYNENVLSLDEIKAFSLLPMAVFGKGMADLAVSGGSTEGVKWADIADTSDLFPLSEVYAWLLYDSLIFAALTWYVDAVFPGEFGTPRVPYFFVLPSYWTDSKQEVSTEVAWDQTYLLPDEPVDQDVLKEMGKVESGAADDGHHAMVVKKLVKRFRATPFVDRPGLDFVAVRGVSFSMRDKSLTAVLGHNGAGKSTLINMLTGMFGQSEGTASIFGMSIENEMDEIRKVLGVCPQHDILWDQMTGKEHLEMFAQLKGVVDYKGEAQARLEQVGLTEHQDKSAGAYSGGMRRRLSVAIALTGDPRVVFLDEPTTGMDPVSRRQVWNIIEAAKKGRAVVLTTHSMEEADMLSDRIMVMARGTIQAIGDNVRLKNRFGSGYKLNVTMNVDSVDSVDKYVLERVPGSHIEAKVESSVAVVTYVLPREFADELPDFFHALEQAKEELGVQVFTVSQTSLNTVFLNLSERTEEYHRARKGEPVILRQRAPHQVPTNQRAPSAASQASDSSGVGPGKIVVESNDQPGVAVVEQ